MLLAINQEVVTMELMFEGSYTDGPHVDLLD